MYLDPGFGSLIIQMLVASFAAAAAMFGIFRVKIATFFKRGKRSTKEKTDDE